MNAFESRAEGQVPNAASLSPEMLAGSWVGDELHRTAARADALTREVEQLRAMMKAQQEELSRLHESLATVQGRTIRHEAGQDLAREARHEVATLQQLIEGEATQRRDLATQVERMAAREHEEQERIHRALEIATQRLDQFAGAQAAGDQRQRTLVVDFAARGQDDQSLDERLGAIERRSAADREAARHTGDALERAVADLPRVVTSFDELQARVQTLQVDQRRLDDEIAALRITRDREADLLDVLEQQRSSRARTEERLNTMEERVEEVRRAAAGAADDRTLFTRSQAGIEERLRALGEVLEAQRQLIVQHLQRLQQADEQAGRRHIEEIQREARAARDLMVRLSEQSDELGGGQPL